MNGSKTKYVIHKHPYIDEKNFKVEIVTKNGEVLKDDLSIKVLCFWMTRKNSSDQHLRKMKNLITLKLQKVKPATDLMTTRMRKIVLYSKVASILSYGSPLFSGETESVKNVYHTALMRINRAITNEYIYNESCEQICSKASVPTPLQLLSRNAAIYAHKIVREQKPEVSFYTIRVPLFPRACQDLFSRIEPRTIRHKRSLIYRIPKIFNTIPSALKFLPTKLFRKRVKKFDIADSKVD